MKAEPSRQIPQKSRRKAKVRHDFITNILSLLWDSQGLSLTFNKELSSIAKLLQKSPMTMLSHVNSQSRRELFKAAG